MVGVELMEDKRGQKEARNETKEKSIEKTDDLWSTEVHRVIGLLLGMMLGGVEKE